MSPVLTPPVGPRDHTLGPPDAPVTLVEYGDYECPHCARAEPIVASVRARLGDLLRFAYRDFPLTEIHPHAEHAAEMSEAAATKGQFWPMHDILFARQFALEDEHLVVYAAMVGLDPTWAAAALESHAFAPFVREDFVSGVRSGVNGTPTFFINGVRHDRSWEEPELLHALQSAAYSVRR